MRQRRTEAAGGGFQGSPAFVGQRTGPDRFIPQNFFQRKNLLFGDQHSILAKTARRLSATAVMRHRRTAHIEFKPEWRTAVLCPSSDGWTTYGFDDLRGLQDVIKPLAVDDVRLGRSSRCFGRRLHLVTKRNSTTKINRNVGGVAYGGAAE
jgi:hypothetical protein